MNAHLMQHWYSGAFMNLYQKMLFPLNRQIVIYNFLFDKELLPAFRKKRYILNANLQRTISNETNQYTAHI